MVAQVEFAYTILSLRASSSSILWVGAEAILLQVATARHIAMICNLRSFRKWHLLATWPEMALAIFPQAASAHHMA